MFHRYWYLLYGLMLIAVVGGCQQRAASKLQGRWVGRPDAAAERVQREAIKYGDTESSIEGEAKSVEPENVTDWEQYDATVTLEFADRQTLEMSLAGNSQTVSGTWEVVSTSPIGCTIEVITSGEIEPSADGQTSAVRRQFQLELDEREGECVGFTMMEVGADRQLGALYFRRPE